MSIRGQTGLSEALAPSIPSLPSFPSQSPNSSYSDSRLGSCHNRFPRRSGRRDASDADSNQSSNRWRSHLGSIVSPGNGRSSSIHRRILPIVHSSASVSSLIRSCVHSERRCMIRGRLTGRIQNCQPSMGSSSLPYLSH